MSDPGFREFEVEINGELKTAKVPSDNVDAWMQRMDERGVAFRTRGSDAAGAQLPAEPEPAPAPAAAAPATAPDEEMGVWDHLSAAGSKGWDAISEAGSGLMSLARRSGLTDAAAGAGQGATMRWGDEGAAALAEAAPREGSGLDALARRALNFFGADLPEVDPEAAAMPRTYAAGSRYADLRNTIRRDNTEAQARSPGMYLAGEVLGSVPGAIATAPAAGGTLPARIAANMAAGAGYGAVSGAGGAEGDASDTAFGALEGATAGAALGGAVTGAAGKVGQAARSFVPAADRTADRLRAASTGAYGSELKALTEQHGPEFAEQLGQNIERMGLHKVPGAQRSVGRRALGAATGALGGGALGSVAGAGYGAFTGDVAGGAKTGAMLGAGLGALRGAGPRLPTPAIYRENAAAARATAGDAIGQALDDATAQGVHMPKEVFMERMRGVLRSFDDVTPEGIAERRKIAGLMARANDKFDDLITPKQLFELKKTYEHNAGFKPTRATPPADTARYRRYQAAATVPRKGLHESIDELALPETATQFARANDDYAVAATVENLSGRRAAQELGNQRISLPALATGSIPGAVFAEGVKRYGNAAGASGIRALANRGRSVAGVADAITGVGPQRAPAASTGRALLDMVRPGAPGPVAAPVGQAAGLGVTGMPAQAAADRSQPVGVDMENAVRQAAEQNPALLGPYADRVQQALQDDRSEDAMTTLLYELAQDPGWREVQQRLMGNPQ